MQQCYRPPQAALKIGPRGRRAGELARLHSVQKLFHWGMDQKEIVQNPMKDARMSMKTKGRCERPASEAVMSMKTHVFIY
jgi:hypothetical protein